MCARNRHEMITWASKINPGSGIKANVSLLDSYPHGVGTSGDLALTFAPFPVYAVRFHVVMCLKHPQACFAVDGEGGMQKSKGVLARYVISGRSLEANEQCIMRTRGSRRNGKMSNLHYCSCPLW